MVPQASDPTEIYSGSFYARGVIHGSDLVDRVESARIFRQLEPRLASDSVDEISELLPSLGLSTIQSYDFSVTMFDDCESLQDLLEEHVGRGWKVGWVELDIDGFKLIVG